MTSTSRTYPATIRVGGSELTLRLLEKADTAAVLEFARALPAHDLMFLRRDITVDAEVDGWLEEISHGEATTILAAIGNRVVGYATVSRSKLPWSAHVAELRVLTAPSERGKGLGRRLTEEAFELALSEGLEKMMAQMTLDQKGAISTFESLGFRPEALLRDHVKDREGGKHDLLVLSHEVKRFQAQRAAFGVPEAIAEAGY
jgi:L-amino acid N-acyltransferase YncA